MLDTILGVLPLLVGSSESSDAIQQQACRIYVSLQVGACNLKKLACTLESEGCKQAYKQGGAP